MARYTRTKIEPYEAHMTEEEIGDVTQMLRHVYETISGDISQIEDWDDAPESWAEVILDANRPETIGVEDDPRPEERRKKLEAYAKFRTIGYTDRQGFVKRRVL